MKKHSLKEQAIPSLHFGDAVTPFIAPDVVPFIVDYQWWGGMPNSLGEWNWEGFSCLRNFDHGVSEYPPFCFGNPFRVPKLAYSAMMFR